MAGINEANGAIVANPVNTGADIPNQPSHNEVARPVKDDLSNKGNKHRVARRRYCPFNRRG